MVITLDWLRSLNLVGDCAAHPDLFERTWGASAEVTRAELLRAADLGLNLRWLADQILEGEAIGRFHAELARYADLVHTVHDAHWAAHARQSLRPHIEEYLAVLDRIDPEKPETEERVGPALEKLRRAEADVRREWAPKAVQRRAAAVLADELGLP